MTGVQTYIVAGTKPWNRRVFDEVISRFPGQWHFCADAVELTASRLEAISPRYVFFLHWSWKVPREIFEVYECVCFHMTDVPYGRGGSPLQNLIIRGHHGTTVTALRMVEEVDAGPVYFKRELSLEGSAEEIYIRASHLSAQMIAEIIQHQPQPQTQTGQVTYFKRRKPSESRIPPLTSSTALYDFIRMLDAGGYPHAFLHHEGFRYEFRRARMHDGEIAAEVAIRPTEGKL